MGNIVEIRTAEPEEFEEAAMVMLKAYEEYSLILSTEEWEGYASRIIDIDSRAKESNLIIAKINGFFVGTVTFLPLELTLAFSNAFFEA